MVVQPRADRWHRSPTPVLGGAAITLAAILIIATLLPLSRLSATITVGLFAAFALGLLDDFRHIAPSTKLVGQAVIASLLFFGGVRVEIIEIEPVAYLVTVLWVVGLMNAVNLIDNMDGLAGGIVAIRYRPGYERDSGEPGRRHRGRGCGRRRAWVSRAQLPTGPGLHGRRGKLGPWLPPGSRRPAPHCERCRECEPRGVGATCRPRAADLRHRARDSLAAPGGPADQPGRSRPHVTPARCAWSLGPGRRPAPLRGCCGACRERLARRGVFGAGVPIVRARTNWARPLWHLSL